MPVHSCQQLNYIGHYPHQRIKNMSLSFFFFVLQAILQATSVVLLLITDNITYLSLLNEKQNKKNNQLFSLRFYKFLLLQSTATRKKIEKFNSQGCSTSADAATLASNSKTMPSSDSFFSMGTIELNKEEKKLATANVLEEKIESIFFFIFCLLNQQFRSVLIQHWLVQLVRAPSCKQSK